MKKTIENLEYIVSVVYDLFDASAGDIFPGIDLQELEEVVSYVETLKEIDADVNE